MVGATATSHSQIIVLKRDNNGNELCDEIRENEAKENRLKQWLPLSHGDGGYWNPKNLHFAGIGGAVGRRRSNTRKGSSGLGEKGRNVKNLIDWRCWRRGSEVILIFREIEAESSGRVEERGGEIFICCSS